MWSKAGRYIPLVLVLVMAACTEVPTVGPELPSPQAVTVASTCTVDNTFTNAIKQGITSYFKGGSTEQSQANSLFNDITTACKANDGATVRVKAQQILGLVDQVYNAGNVNSAAAGAPLTQNLLLCATNPCAAGTLSPALDFGLLDQAFKSSRGLIAFRTTASLPPFVLPNTTPAVARGQVAFINNNNAKWGTEVAGGTWPNIANSDMILIYGLQSPDNHFGLRTAIELRRWPDGDDYPFTRLVVVGACFDKQHISPAGQTVRVLRAHGGARNLALLMEPSFCPPTASSILSASFVAPVAAMARTFRLTRTVALNPTVRSGAGYPDWSEFSSEELSTHVALDLIEEFTSPVQVNVPFGVTVSAIAALGGGTPVTSAPVTLRIFNNSGSPGGALLQLYSGNTPVGSPATSVTVPTNADGIAAFSVAILKTGGYTLCATAALSGYTFQQDCTGLFHVRK